MPEPKKSLTDAEISTTIVSNDKQFSAALLAASDLHEKFYGKGQAPSGVVSVPAADLQKIILTLFAFQKLIGETHKEMRIRRGNTGSGCDYNPFNRVDHDQPLV